MDQIPPNFIIRGPASHNLSFKWMQGSFEDMLLDPKCDPHLTAAGDADIFGSVNLDKLPLLTESTEFAAAALRQPSDG